MSVRINYILFLVILPALPGSLMSAGASQLSVTDSLRQVIALQEDSPQKVDNLINLGRYYFLKYELDSVMIFSDKALELSDRLNYAIGRGDAYYLKSKVYWGKGDARTSLGFIEKSLEIFIAGNDSLRLAKGYYDLATIQKGIGNYDQSLFYSHKSLSYAIPLKKSDIILANYNGIGNVFTDGKSENDSAAYYYLKALDMSEKLGNRIYEATILNNLGSVYMADNQYETARKYFYRSLEMDQEIGNEKMTALNLSYLGMVASKENKTVEANSFYDQAYKLYLKLGDGKGAADVNNNYGDSYFKQKRYDLALEKFDQALRFFRKNNFPKGIITASLNKAAALSMQGKTGEAIALQDSAIALADSIGGKDLLLLAYKNLADNYFKSGDYKNAYTYLWKYRVFYDSIFQIEKTISFNALMMQYDQGKNKARILELEKENLKKTNQRNAFMFTFIGILAAASFTIVYFRQRAVHEKVVARQKILQLEEEKKLMAAKLLVEGQEEERKRIATELHDGLGVLLSATKMQFSTISDKSPENRVLIEKATRMLEQASGDVRKISHNMMPGLLTKLGFYEAVEDLFERIGDSGDLKAVCSITGSQERLPENKEIMLYRIVQEMVNNTLKHAEASGMEIRISEQPGLLDINYSDDGKGFDYNVKVESESMGLKSIQSRVNFLNGKLDVKSAPGKGVNYALQVPV